MAVVQDDCRIHPCDTLSVVPRKSLCVDVEQIYFTKENTTSNNYFFIFEKGTVRSRYKYVNKIAFQKAHAIAECATKSNQ